MQVIGLCRFSYPAIGGFQVEHDRVHCMLRFQSLWSYFSTRPAFLLFL